MPSDPTSVSVSDDPLTIALQPAPDETLEERQAREKNERAAKLRSESIDQYLGLSNNKQEKVTKLLLLGQSESSKRAVLRLIKTLYPIADLTKEGSCSWKATIQLYLIQHVLTVLDVLNQEETTTCPPSSIPVPILPANVPGPSHGVLVQDATPHSRLSTMASAPSNSSSSQTTFRRSLRLRLAPLAGIKSDFTKVLGQSPWAHGISEEPTINSYTARTKHPDCWSTLREASTFGQRFEEEVGRVVNSFKEYIAALWNDNVVRELLRERNVKFEHEGESFLDDLDRVCALDYEPSDSDVCKVRRKTMGVSETNFCVTRGVNEMGTWKVYTLYGSRTLRSAWVPFFDDEGSGIYILEDTMRQWSEICRNRLLANIDLILCFNDLDLLQKKLEGGIHFNKYFTRYIGSNTVVEVCRYIEQKFIAIHREGLKGHFTLPDKKGDRVNNLPGKERKLIVHHMSAVDTDATIEIINEVQDFIFTRNLKLAQII